MSYGQSLRRRLKLLNRPFGDQTARVFGLVLGAVLWTAVATVFPEQLMPFPWELISLTADLFVRGVVFENLWVTLLGTMLGFAGALILGGGIGVVMGTTRYGQRFSTPYVVVGLSIPAVAWAAAATISIGLNIGAPIAAAALTVFPYIAINVWKGIEGIDMDQIRMSNSFGVSNRRILTRLILPSIAPALFSAFRFGIAISWKVVTITEIFAASSGIGYKLFQSYQYYKFGDTWAWACVFFIVILLFEYFIFRPLERKVFEYRPETEFDLLG